MVSLPRIRQQIPNACAILAALMAKSASFQLQSFMKITLDGAQGLFFFPPDNFIT